MRTPYAPPYRKRVVSGNRPETQETPEIGVQPDAPDEFLIRTALLEREDWLKRPGRGGNPGNPDSFKARRARQAARYRARNRSRLLRYQKERYARLKAEKRLRELADKGLI